MLLLAQAQRVHASSSCRGVGRPAGSVVWVREQIAACPGTLLQALLHQPTVSCSADMRLRPAESFIW